MPPPTFQLLVIKSHQLESVRSFYEQIGFQFQLEQHGSGPNHYSSPLGDGIFELYPLTPDAVADTTTRLGFAIPELHRTVKALPKEAVVSAHKETPWGLRAVVKAPDGRSIELYETK